VTQEQALRKVEALRDLENSLLRSQTKLFDCLPLAHIELTLDEQGLVNRSRMAGVWMGPAGVAAMRCEALCPFRAECTLYTIGKHPVGQLCPFEVDVIRERFLGWMRELNTSLDDLLESERITIGNLCSLELELWRIRKVLSRARNAEMNQLSVKDVNAETGEAICWENVIHTAAQRENDVLTQIRMIMKDFEMTPEAKTKRAKALGIRPGNNIASQQSELFDKIRARNRPIDTTASS
jgi:hypothetical protein